MSKTIILCVDDEKTVLISLRQELELSLGGRYAFELAESGEEALEIIEELMTQGRHIGLVISDQYMPGILGEALLAQVGDKLPGTPRILLTGEAALEEKARNAPNFKALGKPWDSDVLLLTVKEFLQTAER